MAVPRSLEQQSQIQWFVFSVRCWENLHLTLRSRHRLQAVEAFGEFLSRGIVTTGVFWYIDV